MKRLFTIALCCLFLSMANVVSAQQEEVKLPADTFTAAVNEPKGLGWHWNDHPGTLSITAGAPSLVGIVATEGIGCYGAYSLRYEHNLKKWLAIGMCVQYEGWKTELASYESMTDEMKNVPTETHHVDMMLGINFTYINREHVQVYSGLGVGIADYIVNGQSRISVAGYLTAVGFRVGSKRVFAMAEVNTGSTSLFNFGLCIKL